MFHRRQKLKNLKQFVSRVHDKYGLVLQFYDRRQQLGRKFPMSNVLVSCELGEQPPDRPLPELRVASFPP